MDIAAPSIHCQCLNNCKRTHHQGRWNEFYLGVAAILRVNQYSKFSYSKFRILGVARATLGPPPLHIIQTLHTLSFPTKYNFSPYMYSVGGKEILVGQKNLYEDPCQNWLDLINMKLTSPNYPEVYDPNTVCKWKLTTDKGYYISLDFDHIHVSKTDDFKNVGMIF